MLRVIGLSLLVSGLLLVSGCVPYVQHQKVSKELEVANALNRDLERALNSERLRLSEIGADGRIEKARFDAAQDQLSGLRSELAACQESRSRLEDQLANMPAVPMPSGFSNQDALSTGFERSPSGTLVIREFNFGSGKFKLKESQRRSLDELARLLKTTYAGREVWIEGHSDVQPIVNTKAINKDNWDLSVKRAHGVFHYLTTEGGITGDAQERFRVVGYGPSMPAEGVVDPTTPQGMKQCRRVEIRLGR